MIAAAFIAACSASLTAGGADAQSAQISVVHFAHASLKPGQLQVITVTARDLAGDPLAHASVAAMLRFGAQVKKLNFPRTNSSGTTVASFKTPTYSRAPKVQVSVIVTNGYLTIPLAGTFSLQSTGRKAVPTPASSSSAALQIVAQALPPSVTAPEPEWLVVYTRSRTGLDRVGAAIDAAVLFKSGTVHVTGRTDNHGVATLRVDTAKLHASETVQVSIVARWQGELANGIARFSVKVAPLLPTVAPTPTPQPTASPRPTPKPTATSTVAPTAVPTVLAFVQPTDAPTEVPTPQPTATDTPVPTPTTAPSPAATSTPVPIPTFTPTARPTATAFATRVPTATAIPRPTATTAAVSNCPPAFADSSQSQVGCMNALVGLINNTRSQYGVPPVTLDMVQSNGTGSCVGSVGHSEAMAQSGSIWHENSSYPSASWPNNVCNGGGQIAENVGMAGQGNELSDIEYIHTLMMDEAHDPGTCAQSLNHACNILNRAYTRVGIGLYESGGATWITEDFSS